MIRRNLDVTLHRLMSSLSFLWKERNPSIEQTWISFTYGGYVPFVTWIWRGRLNIINTCSLFCYFLPFGKGVVLPLNKIESLEPKMFRWKFGWNYQCFTGKGPQNYEKFTGWRTNTRTTIRTVHVRFQLCLANDGYFVFHLSSVYEKDDPFWFY